MAGIATMFVVLALAGLAVLLVVGLLARLRLRYRTALLLVAPVTAVMLMVIWDKKGMAIGLLLLMAGVSLTAGSAVSLLRGRAGRGRGYGTMTFLALGLASLLVVVVGVWAPLKEPNPALAGYRLAGPTLDLPDPSKPGPCKVRYLTYGSGADRYRPEFAGKASFRSHAVDGSKLDADWTGLGGALRTRRRTMAACA